MEEHLDLFSKAELIEGIKGLNDWERERILINMFNKKQYSVLKKLDLNVAEGRKLADKLEKTPKEKRIGVWAEIRENQKKYDKLQKQLNKLDKIIFGGD